MTRSVRRRVKQRNEAPRADERQEDAIPPRPRWDVVQERFFTWLIPVLFFAGAWYGLSSGIGQRNIANDSRSWPKTTGVILTTRVDVDLHRTRGSTITPHVTYGDTVEGASYPGHLIRSDVGGSKWYVAALAGTLDRDFPVGSAIDVWYDPDEPSRAVLEPGGGEFWWISAGAGAAAGLVGVVVLYVTTRDETLRQGVRARRTQTSGDVAQHLMSLGWHRWPRGDKQGRSL